MSHLVDLYLILSGDEGAEGFPVISDAANEQGHPSSPGGSPPSSSSSSSSSAVAPPPAPPPQPAWSPVVAALVWQRMLKILGDINDISQPDMHAEALKCLMETWRSLADVRLALQLSVYVIIYI